VVEDTVACAYARLSARQKVLRYHVCLYVQPIYGMIAVCPWCILKSKSKLYEDVVRLRLFFGGSERFKDTIGIEGNSMHFQGSINATAKYPWVSKGRHSTKNLSEIKRQPMLVVNRVHCFYLLSPSVVTLPHPQHT
jgi:hypothetical protein